MIGIIGAMEKEVAQLKALMQGAEIKPYAGVDFYTGQLFGKQAVVAVSGVGKVNAAIAAQNMITQFDPACIINTGVAGGLGRDVEIGDIVVARDVVQHDMDTTVFGEPAGWISGIDLIHIPADGEMMRAFLKIAEKLGIRVHSGTIASGDQFICETESKNRILGEFGALAAEMEGAAIGHVCYQNSVPFAILRSISDGGDDEAIENYAQFLTEVTEKNIEMLHLFMKQQ